MATVKKDGNQSGMLGNQVYVTRCGKTYVRRAPAKKADKPTEAQKANRGVFAVATSTLSKLSPVFKIGFEKAARPGQTAYNAGLSCNMQRAMVETEEGWQVDWSEVMVASGGLPCVNDVDTAYNENGEYEIIWTPNTGSKGKPDDRVLVTVYDHETDECFFIDVKAKREDQRLVIPKYATESEHPLSVYIFLKRSRNSMVSNSYYVGEFNVEE